MDWTWYLFRFDGRINRAKLWLAGLVMLSGMIFLVALTIGIIVLLSGKPPAQFDIGLGDVFKLFNPATYRSLSWADLPALVSKTVGSALCLWVYLATSIKRLHDRDKRGWWIIPFVVLPGSYNTLSGWWPEDSYLDMLHGIIAFIAYIWGFIEMYCLKGSPKTNRFGADPLTPPPPQDTRPPWDQQSEIEMVPHKANAHVPKSRSLAATTFRELRKVMGISRFRVLVPLVDLKSPTELAACALGTSNRRH